MVPLLGDGDMAKKARKKYKELDFDPFDEFDDLFSDDLDVKELSKDPQRADWDDYLDTAARSSAAMICGSSTHSSTSGSSTATGSIGKTRESDTQLSNYSIADRHRA